MEQLNMNFFSVSCYFLTVTSSNLLSTLFSITLTSHLLQCEVAGFIHT